MSDRWTISTYLNGGIVDVGYYRNWSEESMFYEAVSIMAVFADCRSTEDYWKLSNKLLKEKQEKRYQPGKRFLHEMERESEFPLLVDLTRKEIYSSFCLARNRDLRDIHKVGEPYETIDEYVKYSFRKGSSVWRYLSWTNSRKDIDREIVYIKQRQLPFPLTEDEITSLHVDEMINHYKISFTRKAIHEVRLAFRDEPSLRKYLSTRMSEMISAYVVEELDNP